MKRIPCAFSCSPDFLAVVDERAKALGMNRSQYIVQVLRADIHTRGPMKVVEDRAGYGSPKEKP